MSASRSSSAVYAPESAAVRDARELVRAALADWTVPFGRSEDAVLLASELVTNAIVHAGTEIQLTCLLNEAGGLVRVEVRDLLPLRRLGEPDAGRPEHAVDSGQRGLVLTHSIADAWGVSYTRTDKTVWFELGTAPAELPSAAPAPSPGASLSAGFPAPTLPGLSRLPDEQMIDHVVQWVRATTGADVAYVLEPAADGGLRVRATALADDDPDAKPGEGDSAATDPVGSEDLIAERLAMAEEACRYAAGGPDRGGVQPMPSGGRLASLAVVPAQTGGERLALVVVGSRRAGRFGDPDLVRLRYAAAALGPVLARERRTRTGHGYQGWLGFLAEAGDLLSGTLDENLVPALAAQLFVPRLAHWCAFYLEEQGGTSRLQHVWHADEQRIGALRATLAAAPPPVPHRVRAPRPWQGLGLLGAAERQVCGPVAMEFPLVCRDQRFGVVLLGGPADGEFRSELVRLADDLSGRVARTLLTARRYGTQAATSQILQRSLLPSQLPAIPGLDYHIVYEPAGEGAEAGGDFYDVFPSGPGRWRFMLGDVCGTGPEAAAVTGLARHTLRTLSREGLGVARALTRLNDAMVDESAARLLTMVHGELEPSPEGVLLSVASAGHPLPLRLRPDGGVDTVAHPQMLLGAVANDYDVDVTRLVQGELVLCVTDGITERRDGDRLLDDGDGLARLLSGCVGLTARAVAARVMTAVRDFGKGPPNDDLAILALRVE